MRAVRSTLELADQLKVGSLSMPAISTGIFGFPKDKAARVILRAVSDYFNTQPTSRVHLVRLALFDQETVDVFLKEVK
ncbi:MAG TPA: macro domain-containing protein [Thiobacillus sp.]